MKKTSKKQAEERINEFFKNLSNKNGKNNKEKTSKELKKIKRLAMKHNIKLGDLKKKFCKKCYSVFNFKNSQVRIKNKKKIVKCLNCGNISRWKIK